MNTKAILATIAIAILLAGCATVSSETQNPRCYRTVQGKVPHRVPVPCKSEKSETSSSTTATPAQGIGGGVPTAGRPT